MPRRVTVLGTTSNPRDPDSAAEQVPAALKDLDNGVVNQMVKESGFTVDKFKEVWGV